ncbi:phosphotransferase family protein [Virgibacillus flavescens]|uniref:phosphotransferase family protein n=1 Tax=Virgibacillus flavescens TaxID=1611422 RepID=UPI003D327ED5
MGIENILEKLGLPPSSHYAEISGGRDCQVYKVDTINASYALRILPIHRHNEFIQEKKIIDFAKANGVPVPEVTKVLSTEEYSVMLMEWASGQTVFQELMDRPETADSLGYEFGKTQAIINRITVPATFQKTENSWLSPSIEEEKVIGRIPKNELLHNFVHLDYHPLNVLTDGKKITAVIDWINASIGDYRYDISRTFSLLRLEGVKHFKDDRVTLEQFETGWRKGYEEAAEPFDSLGYLSIFHAWSGLRLQTMLSNSLDENTNVRITEWIAYWLNEFDESFASK